MATSLVSLHLRQLRSISVSALIREGYAVCAANAVGAAPVVAYDSANVEAGWQVPVTISQPNGPNTLPLCITRRTTGNLELQQCFSHIANEREVDITMTLRNLSGATAYNVMMDRYFDGDIAADPAMTDTHVPPTQFGDKMVFTPWLLPISTELLLHTRPPCTHLSGSWLTLATSRVLPHLRH